MTSLSGYEGRLPDSGQTEQAFVRLIEMIHLGQIDSFLTFDREGGIVRLY